MSTQGLPRSRWSLLAIPPTTTEEIAVVPCDGCDKNPHLVRLIQELEQRKTPHLTCIHTLPPLLFNKGPGTQHRYENAQARVSVAGCAENCPQKLLRELLPPEREVILAPDAPFESQVRAVEDAIHAYSALLPQTPQTPAFMMPAAQAPQRRRFAKDPRPIAAEHSPKAAQPTPQPTLQPALTPQVTPKAPSAPPTARFSDPPRGGLFQDQAQQANRKSGPILLFLVLLLAAGGAWWWKFSPKTTPASQAIGARPQTPKTSKRPNPIRPIPREVQATPLQRRPLTQPIPARVEAPKPLPRVEAVRPAPTRPKPPKKQVPQVDQAHLLRSKMVNQGWIGGFCRGQQQCGFNKAMCLPVAQEGYCTRYCLSWCPRPKNPFHAVASCIRADALAPHIDPLPVSKGGLCMTHCNFKLFPKHGCRVGTRCLALPLSRRGNKTQSVCVPIKPTTPEETP